MAVDTEIEKERNAGAPDLSRQWENIRDQVEKEFPNLTPEARSAIIESRLKIESGVGRPKLIKDDFGAGASKKIKDNLFE
jgi:hypothetical protein